MSRYAMCQFCGRRLHRDIDTLGNWDGESYICYHCFDPTNDDDDDDDDDEYDSE